MTQKSWPVLGCGVGLRTPHYPVITETWPAMDWFEALSENYMDSGGRPLKVLEAVRRHYPVALHGTALSIGSADALSEKYLERLKRLVGHIEPFVVSDHLCWSGVKGEVLHDLLPLPFTEDALRHVVGRVQVVQEFLGRRILLENVSSYVTYRHSVIPEWEFLTEVAKRSGCGLLLDINNVYVNAVNHDFDPMDYLKNIPGDLVGQVHLAGHTDMGDFLFDTHSTPVIERVWALYGEALRLWGPVSTLIEWDEAIPAFDVLASEAEKARAIYRTTSRDSQNVIPAQAGINTKLIPAYAGMTNPSITSNDEPHLLLLDIQEELKSRIRPVENNHAPKPSTVFFETLLNPQHGVPGDERLAVHANGYEARIQEALSEVYEAVHHVLGDEEFFNLCHTYAHRIPSLDYNLNFAGRDLPGFLKSQSLVRNFPFLPDLAGLEWLIWRAFHAFDELALTSTQISGIPMEDWEEARMVFQPSVGLISSEWSILEVWKGRRECNIPTAKVIPSAQQILVSRKTDQVYCELLDENQYKLLKGLVAGQSLGAVCEELAKTTPEEPLPLSAWFSRWVNEGLIVRLDFSQASVPRPT